LGIINVALNIVVFIILECYHLQSTGNLLSVSIKSEVYNIIYQKLLYSVYILTGFIESQNLDIDIDLIIDYYSSYFKYLFKLLSKS